MESDTRKFYDLYIKQNPCTKFDEGNIKSISFPNNSSIAQTIQTSSKSHLPTYLQPKVDKTIKPNTREIIKKEFVLFCQNTSIRGVSRIVKSKDRTIFTLWLVFFIFLCIGLLVCMLFLLRQYLEYNVIHPPRVLRNQNSPFPSFTICNLRPLSPTVRSFLANETLRNPREFALRLNRYAVNLYRNRNRKMEYEESTAMSSMAGYLESMPNNFLNQLGHKLDDMVISCKVNYVDGNKPLLDECENVGKWLSILHPQYINCYSFFLRPKFSNKTTTIELFIYLAEEVNTTECIDCFLTNVKTQLSGAVLVIHKHASYPDINQDSVNLQPGTLTEVKIKTLKNKMKTPPYGKCSENTQEYFYISNEYYAYSEMACKYATFQKKINEECKCSAIEFPFINNSTLPFCNAMPHFISHNNCPDIDPKNITLSLDTKCVSDLEKAVAATICKNNITRRYHGDGIEGCDLQCVFYSYETDRSISTWPTKSYLLNWLQSSVAKKIKFRPELSNYEKAIAKLNGGDVKDALDILANQNILEKRLVGVVINKPNYNVHVVEEKEVLSLTSFLSQSGGLLSFWIGLTLINIVEVLEMLIRLTKMKMERDQEETEIFNTFEAPNHPYSVYMFLSNETKHPEDAVDESITTDNVIREFVK